VKDTYVAIMGQYVANSLFTSVMLKFC